MPLPALAVGLGAAAIRRRIAAKMKGKKVSGLKHRRARRIVFSENQWHFVQSLMRMVGGRAPAFPHRRRRRRRRF